ncbi:N-formylglutamate amidohydrolase [Shumkonia mesophila]|uniref:N-formylglutamate amidohydrolase n=1 Tax=Shumkonia mesophila TaxID=2838854 RepID=UPI0029344F02|nr:N-formylglutamate amidohydrolase [Shumkonia mesophila]
MNRRIPGVLTLEAPTAPEVPVVFDSPHSGTVYPDDFDYAAPEHVVRTGEDTYVEELYAAAPRFGAAFLTAHFPRAYIDANRATADIDQELLDAPWPGPVTPSVKTTSGIGLIWRLVRPGCPIYTRKLTVAEVKTRIDTYHQPYQQTLMETVNRAHRRFGGVWHVNCHSMPAVSDERSPEGAGIRRADFVLGNLDGTTCGPDFIAFVAGEIRALGYRVALNDPFKGVELVRMVGAPAKGRHSLQIEINRDLFLDDATKVKTAGFGKLKADITTLIGRICDFAKERTKAA